MNANSAVELLRNFPLFKGLTESEFIELGNLLSCKTKPKYTTLYETGEPSDKVYFLFKGTVKSCTLSSDGREVIKTIMHPVTLFGELGLVGEKHRHETAITMNEEVYFGTLSIPDFQRLMHSNHFLCLNILEMVGNRLLKVEEKLEALIFKDARARIIDFLKESAMKIGRKVGYEMLFKHCLTQQDIANITGTSRQTVTSVLNDLRKENLIYFNRNTILIRDLGKLS
ncbi:MAG: Crp/Fnr family transcriptional regulator [Lewinellaceae bacterium]|nr:Crp/Fnr family transcriptional regulator [Saprospiraceae bacterium]MCB9339138.1 Crp/Fnr family transcriptional regulator [Lewinellaceae bacterium]